MRTSETHTSAHVALREATQALSVRRDGTIHAGLPETGHQMLAADVAATLDAVAGLLRSVGVGVRPDVTDHGLLTVAEHVDMAALMARRAGGDGDHTPSATHLEPERCATTDG
jgi:hypothetical protein